MLKFEKLDKGRLEPLMPYFAANHNHLSDFSLGFQYMWSRYLKPDYTFAGNCLIIRELYAGKYYFHYPISMSGNEAEEDAAIDEIERFCRDTDLRLHYTNVPRANVARLMLRYGREVTVTNARRWRDYLYHADDFKNFAGGKYAGQRNHVNKFLKNYPNWSFRTYSEPDYPALVAFLKEYETVQKSKHSFLAVEEMDEVYDLLPNIGRLGMYCGLLLVGDKIVGCSVGERCGDMVVVHVEKALREYEGASPMLAQQFARAFCGEGVEYLNRMDDAGDGGLRKSKLQYLPCEIVDKYNVLPKRAIDGVSKLPTLQTERLLLSPVRDSDAEEYANLASDVERNRFWGYDWREDCKETPAADYFLKLARGDFKAKREMPVGIYADGRLVGEVVLHRFGYRDEAEIGVRLLPEAEGNGYAKEAVEGYARYAFLTLGLERVEAKCFHENARSRKMLLSAGLHPCGEDEIYYYFYKSPSM